jgi:hypothetical protein
MMPPKREVVVKEEKMEEKGEEDVGGKEELKPKARDLVKCVKCTTRLCRKSKNKNIRLPLSHDPSPTSLPNHTISSGCSQSACLQCCSDEKCKAHAESREKKSYNADLLQGNTEIARLAKRQRELIVLPGRFRESGFVFTEQTIKIWDIREYLSNPKWRDDAVRRCQKRKARELGMDVPKVKISRRRFQNFLDNRYNQSTNQEQDSG